MQSLTLQEPLFCTTKGKPVDVPQPLAPLADTHGHLTVFRKHDAACAIARAAFAGVRLLVMPVDPADDVTDVPAFADWFARTTARAQELVDDAVARGLIAPVPDGWASLTDLTSNVYFVAGVHPYGARRFADDPAVRKRLEALLSHERCLGVGEIGLDFGPWNELDKDTQLHAFQAQLEVARERDVPVELHLRDGKDNTLAHDEALRVLTQQGVPRAGCDLHCFTSGPDVLAPFVELGCYAAFGGAATFARSEDIRAAAALCPTDRLLFETDSPYMAPHPLRGQECEPAMVALTAHRVALAREEAGVCDARQTYAAAWNNAHTFFGLA